MNVKLAGTMNVKLAGRLHNFVWIDSGHAFLRGTGLEGKVGAAWALADLFRANRRALQIMAASHPKG